LAFYAGRLGHDIVWRTATAAGLRLPDGDGELVLHTEGDEPETDLLVESVDEAVAAVVAAGGSVRVSAMEIPVGRVAVVADPFGNPLTIVDLSKGRYRTDGDGTVTGVS
jgi:catechol 2,3-dioxygenase-like lactoylglutathione lyase family enzyme